MAQVTGVVAALTPRQWNGKTFHNVKLDNGTTYGFGAANPNCNVGDTVTFDAEMNDKGYWNAKWCKVISSGGAVPQQQAPQQQQAPRPQGAPSRQQSAAAKDSYWDDKAKKDDLRELGMAVAGARNSAIALASAAVAHGIVPLPAKKSDQLEAFKLLINDLTTEFYVNTEKAKKDGGLFPDEVGTALVDPQLP